MAVMLHIDFIGLFVFVEQDDVTHVLVPATASQHGGHGSPSSVPLHGTRLYMTPDPWSEPDISVPLGSTVLRIADDGPARPSRVPPELVDLRRYTCDSISSSLLTGTPDGARTVARIELALGGSLIGVDTATYSFVPGAPDGSTPDRDLVRMATRLQLVTELPDADALVLQQSPRSALRPPVIDDAITLSIFHVPERELPPEQNVRTAQPGERVEHFPVYYQLFESPCTTPEVTFEEGEDEGAFRNGTTKTCPSARA